jgi:hypothetical protein
MGLVVLWFVKTESCSIFGVKRWLMNWDTLLWCCGGSVIVRVMCESESWSRMWVESEEGKVEIRQTRRPTLY